MSFVTDELFTLGNLVRVHGAMDKAFIDSKGRWHSRSIGLIGSVLKRSQSVK